MNRIIILVLVMLFIPTALMAANPADVSQRANTLIRSRAYGDDSYTGQWNFGSVTFEFDDDDFGVTSTFTSEGAVYVIDLEAIISSGTSVVGEDGIEVTGDGSSSTPYQITVTVSDIINTDTLRDNSGNIDLATDGVDDTHPDWGTGANQISAVDLPVDTANFNNLLSGSDSDVKTALETLDDIEASLAAGSDQDIQYNASGALGAEDEFTYNYDANIFHLGSTDTAATWKFWDASAHGITFDMPSMSSDWSFTWPDAVSSAGFVMRGDASGNMAWVANESFLQFADSNEFVADGYMLEPSQNANHLIVPRSYGVTSVTFDHQGALGPGEVWEVEIHVEGVLSWTALTLNVTNGDTDRYVTAVPTLYTISAGEEIAVYLDETGGNGTISMPSVIVGLTPY